MHSAYAAQGFSKTLRLSDLSSMKCTACHADAPRVTAEELETLKPQVPDWEIVERDEIPRLERVFKFPDFEAALAFTNAVGAWAEAEDHHPALLTEWGRVTVTWWTHKIRGLHVNDFIAAGHQCLDHSQGRENVPGGAAADKQDSSHCHSSSQVPRQTWNATKHGLSDRFP